MEYYTNSPNMFVLYFGTHSVIEFTRDNEAVSIDLFSLTDDREFKLSDSQASALKSWLNDVELQN
jgi:hypothetical protein